jgi:L-ascorbate metabolism protein UlaG (beta-lactamase superfamily)
MNTVNKHILQILVWLMILGGLVMPLAATANDSENNSSNELEGKFQNSDISYQSSLSSIWKIAKAYWQTDRVEATPTKAIPVEQLTNAKLFVDKQDAIYRLGHSTLLLKLNSEFILIDPVFSERASPVQWAGPKRFHQSPLSIEQLPTIKAVIISHDHYDHLDKSAILKLADKVEWFVTPLKVGNHLRDWGISNDKISELDWWQSKQFPEINITATPAQHFSGRGLFDKDQTLWASWVIEYRGGKLFYSGDSGYFSGFKEIGERYGPFDFTMIETGAYNALWREIHMTPEQSLQAHLDVKGQYMIPVHNGTFDLALHDWFEPFERIAELAKSQDVSLLTPRFGEAVMLAQPRPTTPWWREILSSKIANQANLTTHP